MAAAVAILDVQSAQFVQIWNLLVVPMLHTKFQLNPISGSGEHVENKF